MRKSIILALVFHFCATLPAQAENEEFYVICAAPVTVGGGIVRHYLYPGEGRVSVRYSYAGTEGDTLLIEKRVTSSNNGSSSKEIIRIPFQEAAGEKKAQLDIKEHSLQFKLNRDGRLIVKEVKR